MKRQRHHDGLADALRRALAYSGAPRFEVADHAPDTVAAVLTHHGATGGLSVWAGASDETVWGDPALNWRFRAWHDWAHVRTGAGFTVADEVALGEWQAAEAERAVGTLFARLVYLEIAGQAQEYLRTGEFIANQAEWTLAQLSC